MRLAAKGDDPMDKDKIIDAIIEEEIAAVDATIVEEELSSDLATTQRQRKRDVIRNVLRRLADLVPWRRL